MAVISFPAAWHSGQSPMLSPAAACTFLQMGQTRYLLSPAASRNISPLFAIVAATGGLPHLQGLAADKTSVACTDYSLRVIESNGNRPWFPVPCMCPVISSARMYLCDAFFGSEPHSKQYRCVLRFGTNSAPQMMHFLDFLCFFRNILPFLSTQPLYQA